MNDYEKELEQLKDIETKYNVKVLYCSEVGSKLFGTNHENSDSDFRFLYMPNIKDLILENALSSIAVGKQTKVKNTKDDIDFDGWSVQHWFNLLRKGETNALNLLFSMFKEDSILYQDKMFTSNIRFNHIKLLTKNMRSFQGYALGQAKKFGIKGHRYNELVNFVEFVKTLQIPEDNKETMRLEYWFDNIEEYILKNKPKYIRIVFAPGPKSSDNSNKNIPYVSVLDKLFAGAVSLEYFLDRITLLSGAFGNRTKSQKNEHPELLEELRKLQELL